MFAPHPSLWENRYRTTMSYTVTTNDGKVTFYKFPDNARRSLAPMPQEIDEQIREFEDAEKVRLINDPVTGIVARANDKHFIQRQNFGNPNTMPSGGVKTWTYFLGDFKGVFFRRTQDGNWVKMAWSGTPHGSTENLNRGLIDFYVRYASHFKFIPSTSLIVVPEDEAQRVQYGPGPAADFPIAAWNSLTNRSTLMPGIGFRFNAANDLEWFLISEYEAAYPIRNVAIIPKPGDSPEARLEKISSILAADMFTATQKDTAIAKIYGAVPPVIVTPPAI